MKNDIKYILNCSKKNFFVSTYIKILENFVKNHNVKKHHTAHHYNRDVDVYKIEGITFSISKGDNYKRVIIFDNNNNLILDKKNIINKVEQLTLGF